MTSSEMLSRAKARAKEREKVAIRRQKTRRTLETRPSRRRTRHGRRSLPRMETRKKRKWASTLTIGVSIIWHGACTSRLNVAWAKSGRRNSRRRSQSTLQTLPRMLPLLLQWLTCTSRLSLPPLAQLCRGRTKKNDGASQQAYGHICLHAWLGHFTLTQDNCHTSSLTSSSPTSQCSSSSSAALPSQRFLHHAFF
jgi:hypothetical protein